MTRLEAGALRVTSKLYDLGEVISAVLEGLAPQLQGREVELEIPEELPLIPQDPILIGQVLINLLDNALKYSPAGSPLRIEVRPAEDRIETAVLDRGPGIPEDEEARVFEKFFRGRGQNAQGSGLGLSICEGLIEAHGGRIGVSPRPGGGTEVTFTLPLKEGECPRF